MVEVERGEVFNEQVVDEVLLRGGYHGGRYYGISTVLKD